MKGAIFATVLVAVIALSAAVPAGTPAADKKKVVCYYGSWATYRPGDGKFDVSHIDPYICTHLIYGFVGLGADNRVKVLDEYNDLEENWGKGAMKKFTALKEVNSELKVSVAIGGWNEGSEKYSAMAASAANRKTFIDSIIPLLQSENFDGLDLDWEYPADRGGKPEDKENFDLLMAELRAAFQPHGYLLTAAVSAGDPTIRKAYNVPNLAKYLDAIHVMAYDMHGAWDVYTHHHTPLYEYSEDASHNNGLLNIDHAIKLWHELGAPYDKLVLGMGTYGRGFTLDDPSVNGIYAPARTGIPAGPYTREAGIWGYNEICERLGSENWKVTRLDDSLRAPYAVNNNLWIGYDDIDSLTVKAAYARDLGLAGAMVWSLETDDFHGRCHGEAFPLIKTIHRVLNGDIVVPPPATTTTTTRDPSAPSEEPTTTTSTTPRPTPPTGKPGEVCQKPGLNRDPEDCNGFYRCALVNGQYEATHDRCGTGTVFNPVYENCDWPANVPGCS